MNPNTGEIRRLQVDEAAPKGWVELKEGEAGALLKLSSNDRAEALRALERQMAKDLMRQHRGRP